MVLRIGLIGCGGIANAHMQVLSNMNEVQLVSFCDIVEDKAREFNAKYAKGNAAVYTDFTRMLEREKLDAVYVCLPPFAHSNEVEIAAENGVHVFIEKPIALDMVKARSMVDAARRHSIKTQVGFQLRFGAAVEYFKKMAEHGEAGPVGLFLAKYYCNSLHSPWWRDKSKSGGQVVEQIIHLYDLSRFMAGEPYSVYCRMDNLFHKDVEGYTVEDVSISILRFKHGGLGAISATNFAIPNKWLHELNIVSRNLTVFFTDANNAVFTRTNKPWEEQVTVASKKNLSEAVNLDFLNAIKKDASTRNPIEEGARSLNLVLSARKSAEENREITIEEL
ncbi:MAG: Gfo/Idh/MocA family oxidoreductase [Thaumarchaeota archaeon]|jgi:predicted dehydrogenase|nr:Gfo/Idh/MocA family oxidoreductase [Nitrososphaerota archaeon]